MATHPLWNDDYWLLVLQLYLKRPTGVKAVYAREAVDLAVELHLPPPFIHQQLQEMDRRDRLVLQLVWKTYAQKPRRLAKDVAQQFCRPQSALLSQRADKVPCWHRTPRA